MELSHQIKCRLTESTIAKTVKVTSLRAYRFSSSESDGPFETPGRQVIRHH